MSDIKVLIKEPGKAPYEKEIANTLGAFQDEVGGNIETFTLAEGFIVICNEEGKILGLPYNCNICGMEFVGTLIFAGSDKDEFADFTLGVEGLREIMPKLFE